MKTYTTITFDGKFAGPDIEACDSNHAEQQAEELGVEVVGELFLRIEMENLSAEKRKEILSNMNFRAE